MPFLAAAAHRSTVRLGLLGLGVALLQLGPVACGARAVDMNVVVFNYGPRPLADVYLNGQHVGAGFGAFGPGGTGGSVSCCHEVAPGTIEVEWMLGGPEGDPLTGTMRSATARLEAIHPDAEYLAVYLYPDGTVAFDTAKGIPEDRLPPGVQPQ